MNSSNSENFGMKQKIVHEIRRLLMIFAYLALFFLVFRFYTRLVLSEYQINYFEYGLTLLKPGPGEDHSHGRSPPPERQVSRAAPDCSNLVCHAGVQRIRVSIRDSRTYHHRTIPRERSVGRHHNNFADCIRDLFGTFARYETCQLSPLPVAEVARTVIMSHSQ